MKNFDADGELINWTTQSASKHAAATSCLDGNDETVVATVNKFNTLASIVVFAAADPSAAPGTATATPAAATAPCNHSWKVVG